MIDAAFRLDVGGFSVESRLRLEAGLLVLFGPSGSGKSLTLQGLAGLLRPSSGRIALGEEVVFDAAAGIDVPAHRRRVGYVPQHHALFPFHDVVGNVAFGLPRARRHARDPVVAGLLDELGIAHLALQRPHSLSGGERQRVALARAIAPEPRLLLLDEPFASLDRPARVQLGGVLRDVLARHGIPGVLVTHDAEEAAALGDAVLRFERGRGVETVDPRELIEGAWVLRGQVIREGGVGGRDRVRVEGALDVPAGALPDGEVAIALRRG